MQKNPLFGTLFEFDLEIKWSFHKLKRQQAFQEEPTTFTMGGGENVLRKTLREYAIPRVHSQPPISIWQYTHRGSQFVSLGVFRCVLHLNDQ